jgi:hypothetical protein
VGAALTSPDAMERALIKIHGFDDESEGGEKDFKMLMFRAAWNGHWFATHPTLKQRTAALGDRTYLARIEALAGTIREPAPVPTFRLPLQQRLALAKSQPVSPQHESFEWPNVPGWAPLLGLFLVVSTLSFFVSVYVL